MEHTELECGFNRQVWSNINLYIVKTDYVINIVCASASGYIDCL